MKILLVDDEKKFAMMLSRRLDLRGFQVHFVHTGADAIEMVKSGEHFDVAILDVKMPGIGGIQLRRELQRLDPGLTFIFLTGHGSQMDSFVGATEAALYLPKPLRIDDLVAALLKMTAREQAQPTTEERDG
jgi:DNA-binding response OmpR family regulator